MKVALPITISLLVALSFPVFAADVMPSEIKKVTLFSGQALVVREAGVKLSAGTNVIVFDAAAYDIDDDSIQVDLFGEGSVLSVQSKEIPLKEAPQENVRLLEESIRQARLERSTLSGRLDLLGKKESFLDNIVKFAGVQVPAEIKTNFPKPEDLQKMLGFLDEGYTSVNKERQGLGVKTEELDKQIAVMEEQLSGLKKERRDHKKAIEVVFDSAREQEAKVEMSYIVFGASWEPFYKAEVPEDLKSLTMTMFAKIVQTTGEDWKGVNVSVSNAVPLKGTETPSVGSWYLSLAQPPRPRTALAAGVTMDRSAFMKAEAPAALESRLAESDAYDASPAPAPLAFAERKDLALAFEYDLPKALDIESRDKETAVPLFSKQVKGAPLYYAAPAVTPLAFLIMRTAADKEMLAAPVNVYLDARYVGSTYLAEKRPQEEFDINLGADRMVKVTRVKTLDKLNETFMKNVERFTVIRQLSYKITMENLKDKPVAVRLVDAIPVSKTDKIEIKDLRISPEPLHRSYQDKEGVMLWEVALPSGEKREVAIDFTVTYPKDAVIAGL